LAVVVVLIAARAEVEIEVKVALLNALKVLKARALVRRNKSWLDVVNLLVKEF
jgi:hypothetical protein